MRVRQAEVTGVTPLSPPAAAVGCLLGLPSCASDLEAVYAQTKFLLVLL